MPQKAHWLIAGTWFLIVILIGVLWNSFTYAATAGQVQVCAVALSPSGACAKVICGPQAASDLVRTHDLVNVNRQFYVRFDSLTAASPVVNCAGGQWSTLGAVGAVVPGSSAPPPVTPPPPPLPPPTVQTHDYVVSFGSPITGYQVQHSVDGGASWDTPVKVATLPYTYKALPTNITQCFGVSTVSGTQVSAPTITCIPAQSLTVQ